MISCIKKYHTKYHILIYERTFVQKKKSQNILYIYHTSGSQSITSRVKGLRRPAKKKQKKPPDSPGSTQHK
jgi:hypothetical protein